MKQLSLVTVLTDGLFTQVTHNSTNTPQSIYEKHHHSIGDQLAEAPKYQLRVFAI